MYRILFLLLLPFLILLTGCTSRVHKAVWGSDPALRHPKTEMDDFLRMSVRFGLETDQFPVETAAAILENEHNFVPKCPVCTPVQAAFRDYVQQGRRSAKTNMEESELAALTGADKDLRQTSFRDLIARYTSQFYQELDFTEGERAFIESELAAARKTGMGYKPESFGLFCPSCDGACQMKP
jgi:hypothetical protein